MKESTSKPLRDPVLDAFTEAATKAMWRAHRAAVREDARYGLAPVLERPRRLAKKK